MLWDFNSLQSKFCCFSIKTFFSFLNKKAKKAKILRNEKKCRSSFCSYKVNIRHCPPKSSFVVSFMSHFAEKFLDFLLKTFPSERKNFAKDFFSVPSKTFGDRAEVVSSTQTSFPYGLETLRRAVEAN